ncbi:MAG: hypothetical protein KY447_07260 [Actinobacteria bacterium]|nr:hypothetical protein [Actinomycetota bacterium]
MATPPATTSSAASRRQAAMLATERRWWQEINRAQLAFAECVNNLERSGVRWDARITSAMRGIDPETWWRCHRRIEAGERWVGANATDRRVQRIVYATRQRALELVAERDASVTTLKAACGAAEVRLRAALRNPGAAFGVRETARRLGLPESTVAVLLGSTPLSAADRLALCRAHHHVEVPG